MRPASSCLGQEVRLCEITMFGGLSPLRGPLATGAAKARIAKPRWAMQGVCWPKLAALACAQCRVSGRHHFPPHHDFGLQAFDIAIDRGDCEHAAVALIA